jgi:hypothetical protein
LAHLVLKDSEGCYYRGGRFIFPGPGRSSRRIPAQCQQACSGRRIRQRICSRIRPVGQVARRIAT